MKPKLKLVKGLASSPLSRPFEALVISPRSKKPLRTSRAKSPAGALKGFLGWYLAEGPAHGSLYLSVHDLSRGSLALELRADRQKNGSPRIEILFGEL